MDGTPSEVQGGTHASTKSAVMMASGRSLAAAMRLTVGVAMVEETCGEIICPSNGETLDMGFLSGP